MEIILQAQREDESLKKMEDWRERPALEEVAVGDAELKIFWSEWNQIKKEGEVWYYLWKQGEKETWKIIVPVALREEIMKEHHDSKGAGHFGVMKTLEKLKASPYYWPEMRKSVEK